MATRTPTLAPLFRSDLQFRLLGYLASGVEQEASVSDLATAVDASYGATWAEVQRLLDLGVLEERRVGRSKLVRFSNDPSYAQPLRQLLLHTYGPLPLLRDHLEPLEQVRDAVIYGSWARRYVGELGRPPRDVDVLVLIAPAADPVPVYQACSRVTDATGQTVNPTVLSADAWERDDTAFATSVKQQPRIGILGDDFGRVRS